MKLKSVFLISSLFALCLTGCGEGTSHAIEEYKAGEVHLDADGELKILQLTDIHLSNKDNQQLQLDFLSLTINEAKTKGAGLIVLTGDTFTFADKTTAKMFFNWLDAFGLPWTITFGNHDEQCYFSVTWLTRYLNNFGKNCIFKDIQGDDINGNANFYIDVLDNDNKLFERVIIFDSNRYYFSDYMGYDYIKDNQIEWYKKVIDLSPEVKSTAFFHIPLPEYLDAINLKQKGSSEIEYFGGENYEGISCPKYNSGLFEVMKQKGSTYGVFVGHDHKNDTAIKYQGITLSYGRNSTDRIYSQEGRIGGQLITINDTHSFNTDSFDRITHEYSEVEGK